MDDFDEYDDEDYGLDKEDDELYDDGYDSDDEDNYDIIDEVWSNKELQDWLRWVNKNITLQLGVANYKTLGVLLRNATSRLDKMDLPFRIGCKIHYYLCNNTWNEHHNLINQDLPF